MAAYCAWGAPIALPATSNQRRSSACGQSQCWKMQQHVHRHACTSSTACGAASAGSMGGWTEQAPAGHRGGTAGTASSSSSSSSEPLRADWPRHKLVTALAFKAPDLQELEGLYEEYGSSINAANAVAMLTQLSRLYPAKALKHMAVQQRVVALAFALAQRLATETELKVQERIQAVSALARLGLRDPRRFSTLLSRLLEAPPHFDHPSQYAEAAWAVARLGHDPGHLWIAELLDASRTQLQAFQLAELANVIWALAKWGYRPGMLWTTLFFKRCLSVLSRPGLADSGLEDDDGHSVPSTSYSSAPVPATAAAGARQLPGARGDSNSLVSLTWGLAMLNITPPREVAAAILAHSQALFPVTSAQGFANIAWALCRLDVRPPSAWVAQLIAYSRMSLPSAAAGMSCSNLVWALANWRAAPDTAWLAELVRCATPLLPGMQPDEIATLLQGLADLEHKPPAPWVSAALEVFHKNFEPAQDMQQQQQRKHHSHDPSTSNASAAPSSRSTSGLGKGTSPATIARLLWSISKLLQTRTEASEPGGSASYSGPGKAWLRFYGPVLEDLLDALAPGLPRLPAPMLVDVIVALADLQLHPGVAWLAMHERCCSAAMPELTAYQVNLLFSAVDSIQGLELPPVRTASPTAAQARVPERGTGMLGLSAAAEAADLAAEAAGIKLVPLAALASAGPTLTESRTGEAHGTTTWWRRRLVSGRHGSGDTVPLNKVGPGVAAAISGYPAKSAEHALRAVGTLQQPHEGGAGASGSAPPTPPRGSYRPARMARGSAGYHRRGTCEAGASLPPGPPANSSDQALQKGIALARHRGAGGRKRNVMLTLPPPPALHPLAAESKP